MDIVFKYEGKDVNGVNQSGMVIALDLGGAHKKIMAMGVTPIVCEKDINLTVSIIGDIENDEFFRLYKFIGRLTKNGTSLFSAMEDYIDLIDDVRMRCMISMVTGCLRGGFSISNAMEEAGFPEKHFMTVRALEESGESYKAFERLSKECNEQHILKKEIKSMLLKPKLFFSIFAVVIYAFFGFFMYRAIGGLVSLVGESKVPEYSVALGNLSLFCSENIVMFTVMYWGSIFLSVWFVKTRTFKKIFNSIPAISALTEKIDMYNGWSSFGTLNSAGVPNRLTCEMVSKSVNREDVEQMFLIMRTSLESGDDIPTSVGKAGFPPYIYKKIKAISLQSGSDTGEQIVSMAGEIKEQVDVLVDKLKKRSEMVILFMTAGFVLIFFLLTYYPMLKATLSGV